MGGLYQHGLGQEDGSFSWLSSSSTRRPNSIIPVPNCMWATPTWSAKAQPQTSTKRAAGSAEAADAGFAPGHDPPRLEFSRTPQPTRQTLHRPASGTNRPRKPAPRMHCCRSRIHVPERRTRTTQPSGTALNLFRKAAEQGSGPAMAILGHAYMTGSYDVQPDFALARDWYLKATELRRTGQLCGYRPHS